MPIVSFRGLLVALFCGVWLVGFGVSYPLVGTDWTALLLVDSASAGFRILHGFKFVLAAFWVVGVWTSTESLILAQDERWRRA